MAQVDELCFEREELLGEDLLRFSEAVDLLVEEGVGLQDFCTAVAQNLRRRVRADIFRQSFQAAPVDAPLSEASSCLGEGEILLWLSPPLPDLPARLLGQRLIHAIRIILRQGPSGASAGSESDCLRALLGGAGTPTQRASDLERLGLSEHCTPLVAAIAGDVGELSRAHELACCLSTSHPVRATRLGDVLAVVLRERPPVDVCVPKGLSVGLGEALPPGRIHESWEGAKQALRFALPSRSQGVPSRMIDATVVDIAKAGCLRILVDAVDHLDVAGLGDVQTIRELEEKGLPDTLNVLEAVAATESIRQAAQLVHLHHNTVASRVEAAEEALGFHLRENYGRTRLLVALTLYRLHGSSQMRRLEGAFALRS